MSVESATKRRLDIAVRISDSLRGIVEGVMLGGSMGFGQNYSVSDESDIDLVVVIKRKQLNLLDSSWYFKDSIHQEARELFEGGTINFFWVTKIIDDVEVNVFIYDSKDYNNFCLLCGNLVGFLLTRPAEMQTGFGFDGREIIFPKNVRQCGVGYLYEKPALFNGVYWGGVPRQDFLYSGHILYENEKFLTQLEALSWNTLIAKMVSEYGPSINLCEINMLNTHYAYMMSPEKVPDHVVEKIKVRTRTELQLFQGSK